jgi:hypothetical protein
MIYKYLCRKLCDIEIIALAKLLKILELFPHINICAVDFRKITAVERKQFV